MNKREFTKLLSQGSGRNLIKAHPERILQRQWMNGYGKVPASEWRNTFVGAFILRTPNRPQILDMICEALGKKQPTWADLTKVNLMKINQTFYKKVSPNSANLYLRIFKAILNEYSEEGVIPTRDFKNVLRGQRVPSQHVALTLDEVEKWEYYYPKSTPERDIKCIFMRACYTGARYSDARRLSVSDIVGQNLVYVSQKTKVEVVLPVHRELRKYLEYHITKSYPLGEVNTIIRRICRDLGINEPVKLFTGGRVQEGPKYKFISMHSARRTFCTILAQMGVGVETIRTMAGHTSSSMTDRYICLDGRNPGQDAMKFFNGENY